MTRIPDKLRECDIAFKRPSIDQHAHQNSHSLVESRPGPVHLGCISSTETQCTVDEAIGADKQRISSHLSISRSGAAMYQ